MKMYVCIQRVRMHVCMHTYIHTCIQLRMNTCTDFVRPCMQIHTAKYCMYACTGMHYPAAAAAAANTAAIAIESSAAAASAAAAASTTTILPPHLLEILRIERLGLLLLLLIE